MVYYFQLWYIILELTTLKILLSTLVLKQKNVKKITFEFLFGFPSWSYLLLS